jgi:hypothetical protein
MPTLTDRLCRDWHCSYLVSLALSSFFLHVSYTRMVILLALCPALVYCSLLLLLLIFNIPLFILPYLYYLISYLIIITLLFLSLSPPHVCNPFLSVHLIFVISSSLSFFFSYLLSLALSLLLMLDIICSFSCSYSISPPSSSFVFPCPCS